MTCRLLLATFFFAISNLTAYACSCRYDNRPFNDRIATYEIVFLGTPIETNPVNQRGGVVTRFQIATPIKGDVGETFDIHHEIYDASCGVSFKPGALNYIHTNSYNGKYRTGLCSRWGLKLETFQEYVKTEPQERSCMDQISKALAPYMEPETLKAYNDPSTEKEPYSLSLLNLDPVCEAFWPSYQKTFGGSEAKTFHSIISEPAKTLTEPRQPPKLQPKPWWKFW